MALIPLYEAKTYLRMDSSDEDVLIGILLSSAEQMCKDVGRLSEEQWEAVNAADRDAENGVQPTRELEALRSTCRVAILYALGYPKAENFGADNLVYHHFNRLDIEVYTDYKDPDMEASIEEVLTAHELYYEKSEVWIETEKMYEVLYELTV